MSEKELFRFDAVEGYLNRIFAFFRNNVDAAGFNTFHNQRIFDARAVFSRVLFTLAFRHELNFNVFLCQQNG